jgi:ABC-2 type transport system permease protein
MTITTTAPSFAPTLSAPRLRVHRGSALATLTARRLSLSAHTPRELLVPLLTPILFALVIAPALAKLIGPLAGGLDYTTFVAVGTVGLLVPLSCTFAGLGVIVDRESGARRELIAAPVPRALHVLGNLSVALVISGLQLVALIAATLLRGSHFTTSSTGIVWFIAAAVLFAVFSYGLAETMANRIPTQAEFVGATPAVAILPWFLAGSLFPLSTLPVGLAALAKVLPLTHAMALMRYGLIDPHGRGLHDVWGMSNTTVMAGLSLMVVAAYAALLTFVSIRAFSRSAVQ